jgi:hypothetical protein
LVKKNRLSDNRAFVLLFEHYLMVLKGKNDCPTCLFGKTVNIILTK